MKIVLSNDDLTRVLTGYATNTLGIAANRIVVDQAANGQPEVVLWWEPSGTEPKRKWWNFWRTV